MRPRILLCAATRVEAQSVRKGISWARAQALFEVLRTGIGSAQARTALLARLSGTKSARPALIVSTGFAGSTSPEYSLGSWALGRTVASETGTRHILPSPAGNLLFRKTSAPKPRVADFLSVTKPTTGSAQATAPAPRPGPVLVDMESFAWAEVSFSFDIPFLILRMISDTPEHPLPDFVGSFASALLSPATPVGRQACFSGLRQMLARPGAAAGFLRRGSTLPKRLAEGWQRFAFDAITG